MLSHAQPNPQSPNLYEAYANEELIFEWEDLNPQIPILEFMGIGGDYFALRGCTHLKLRAILRYQIESYFWDLDCANWSEESYQSDVIQPLEILQIQSQYLTQSTDFSLYFLDMQILKLPRLFELHKRNFPNLITRLDATKVEKEIWE